MNVVKRWKQIINEIKTETSSEPRLNADHDNIVTLCRFLHDVKGIGIEDLLYALEKPYKYEQEWKECVQYWKERDEE